MFRKIHLCKLQIAIMMFIMLTSCTTIQKTISGESTGDVKDLTASQRLQISIPIPDGAKYD